MRVALFVVPALLTIATADVRADNGHDLPAKFVADRVFVSTQISGEKVDFYTDSGGGTNLMCRTTAKRLKLATVPFADNDQELGKNVEVARLGDAFRETGIPINVDGDDGFLVYDCSDHGTAFGD